MQKVLFPLLIVAACAGAGFAMTRPAAADQELTVRMPVVAAETPALSPFLQAAARDLGHSRVRAYDHGVFIDVGDDTIAFYKAPDGLEMHVAFETKYRHSRAERSPALKALKLKGESIFAHAKSLQARDAAAGAVASRAVASSNDG